MNRVPAICGIALALLATITYPAAASEGILDPVCAATSDVAGNGIVARVARERAGLPCAPCTTRPPASGPTCPAISRGTP